MNKVTLKKSPDRRYRRTISKRLGSQLTSKESFGQRVRALREGMNLKQSELAQMLGVSSKAISKIERGENGPKFERIEDIAKALGCTKAYLIEGETEHAATA